MSTGVTKEDNATCYIRLLIIVRRSFSTRTFLPAFVVVTASSGISGHLHIATTGKPFRECTMWKWEHMSIVVYPRFFKYYYYYITEHLSTPYRYKKTTTEARSTK